MTLSTKKQFNKEFWFGYVIDNLVSLCLKISKEQCKACQDKIKSPILHYHLSLSLEQIIDNYLDQARGQILGSELEALFNKFSKNIPEAKPMKKECLVSITTLLLHATAPSLYYGRWVTPEVEIYLRDAFVSKSRKRKKKNKENEENELEKLLIKCFSEVLSD